MVGWWQDARHDAQVCLAIVALVIRFAVRLRYLGRARSPRRIIEKVLGDPLACPCCMQGRPAINPPERREEHAVEVTSAGAFQCCLHAKSFRGWSNDPLRDDGGQQGSKGCVIRRADAGNQRELSFAHRLPPKSVKISPCRESVQSDRK